VSGWTFESISSGAYKGKYIRLRSTTNNSRFREGNNLVLSRSNPHIQMPCTLNFNMMGEMS